MQKHLRNFLLFLAVSWLFRVFYLLLFYDRYSFDMAAERVIGDLLMLGENPYKATTYLNWPPVWMQFIYVFEKISRYTHWRFFEVLRGFLILAESGMAALLYAALVRFTTVKEPVKLLIFGIALNPLALLQVCQHCHFDVLVGFWVLLAVYMLLRFQEQHESRFWLFACFAVGMGAVTKTVPLSLAPLLLLSIRKIKFTELILGAAFLLGPITLGMSIIYVLAPAEVTANVLNYRSTPGHFGFTGLFQIFGAEHLVLAWPHVFEIVYGTGWVMLGAWLLTRETLGKLHIVSLASGLLIAICATGPGYAQNYVYWFMPLLVLQYALAERRSRIFLGIGYAIAAITYLILYGMNYALGAFLFDLTQNETMVKWGATISTAKYETLISLPLWIVYWLLVVAMGRKIVQEMVRDFKKRSPQK